MPFSTATDERGPESGPRAFAGVRARLRRRRRYIAGIATLFFAAGVLFWGGLNAGVDMTNTLEFCTTCHEMRDNVYLEYKDTVHYSNRSGIRAICSDCHVPKDWSHKMARKVTASLELWAKITGTVETKPKFEARRLALATKEWERLKESNSRECRNCHAFDAMSPGLQKPGPYKIHMQAREEAKTCIDCHKGVAHRLPGGYKPEDPQSAPPSARPAPG